MLARKQVDFSPVMTLELTAREPKGSLWFLEGAGGHGGVSVSTHSPSKSIRQEVDVTKLDAKGEHSLGVLGDRLLGTRKELEQLSREHERLSDVLQLQAQQLAAFQPLPGLFLAKLEDVLRLVEQVPEESGDAGSITIPSKLEQRFGQAIAKLRLVLSQNHILENQELHKTLTQLQSTLAQKRDETMGLQVEHEQLTQRLTATLEKLQRVTTEASAREGRIVKLQKHIKESEAKHQRIFADKRSVKHHRDSVDSDGFTFVGNGVSTAGNRNRWWLLPLVTLVCGIGLGYTMALMWPEFLGPQGMTSFNSASVDVNESMYAFKTQSPSVATTSNNVSSAAVPTPITGKELAKTQAGIETMQPNVASSTVGITMMGGGGTSPISPGSSLPNTGVGAMSTVMGVVGAGASPTSPILPGLEFVNVTGSKFIMGAGRDHGTPLQVPEHSLDVPQQEVIVKDFAISRYEVTFAQYDAFAIATGRKLPDDNKRGRHQQPVVNISWNDALTYTQWLSANTGQHYRLPTEAEWEYAINEGRRERFWWGNDFIAGKEVCLDCGTVWGGKSPAPVGSMVPNHLGLYDMAGNVMEWVSDCSRHVDGVTIHTNSECQFRVVRGGAYNKPNDSLRSTIRRAFAATDKQPMIGFRVVRQLQ